MEREAARIGDDAGQWRARRGGFEPVAMWPVSTLVRGSWTPVETRIVEASVLRHETLAMRATAALETFANAGVSAVNDELIGPIFLDLDLRFADGSATRPGTHGGIAEWGPHRWVTAVVRGTNNPATRWSIGSDDPVPPVGRLVGHLYGSFAHDTLGTCLVEAVYVLEIDDYAEHGSAVVGSIEGVVTAGDGTPG